MMFPSTEHKKRDNQERRKTENGSIKAPQNCNTRHTLPDKNRNPVCNHLPRPSQGRIQARYPPTTPSGTLLRAPFRASVVTGRFTRLAAPPCGPPFRGGHAEGLDVWGGQAIDMLIQRRPQQAQHSQFPASHARMTRERSPTQRSDRNLQTE